LIGHVVGLSQGKTDKGKEYTTATILSVAQLQAACHIGVGGRIAQSYARRSQE
jgi:hypothetical protein